MEGCLSIENLLSLEILTFCETGKWHTNPIQKNINDILGVCVHVCIYTCFSCYVRPMET